MTDINTELELAKLRSLIDDARDVSAAERPGGWENMPMWGGGADYSDFAFGFSISGAVVTVNAGYVFWGTQTPVTVAGTDITIEADNTYISVLGSMWASAAITSSTTFPQHAESTINWLLYRVRLSGGVARIGTGDISHLGSIQVPGAFAHSP